MAVIQKDISLKNYNTFGIDIKTKGFVKVEAIEELPTLIEHNPYPKLLVLGGGSNILFTQDFEGLTLLMANKGITKIWETEKKIGLEIAAGENWHELVLWALEHHYGGLENLALIPGSVGAAPIQNIGAYGVEFESVFHSCKVLEIATLKEQVLSKADCQLSYRNSIFKNVAKGKFIILSVQIELQKAPHAVKIEYGALKEHIHSPNPTIQDVAQAVIQIRTAKLPNPEVLGNGGSFFKNPVVTETTFKTLQKEFPQLPHYPQTDGVKIPAAWLIDHLGFKGYQKDGAGVHQQQALVLVNHGQATGSTLVALAETIEQKVASTFGITLEREVNVW